MLASHEKSADLFTANRCGLLRNAGIGTAFAAASGLGLFSPTRAREWAAPTRSSRNRDWPFARSRPIEGFGGPTDAGQLVRLVDSSNNRAAAG